MISIVRKKTKIIFFAFLVPLGVFFFMNHVEASMSDVKNIVASADNQGILIEWTKPVLQETEGIVIVRKQSTCPENFYDGEILYRGNGNSLFDSSASKNNFYCYSAFVYDSSGAISLPKTSGLVKVKTIGEYAERILENNIFIGIGIILIVILIGINIWKRRRQ
jgi:hypothetical protein